MNWKEKAEIYELEIMNADDKDSKSRAMLIAILEEIAENLYHIWSSHE